MIDELPVSGNLALQQKLKRTFDLVFCILVLPVVLMLLIPCALLIKLDSPGPVFFLQERVGRNRARFRVVKLRTMVPNAASMGAGLYTIENDPRFTRIGLLLRRMSLDELPQVFNDLLGSMSVVGPRPFVPAVVEEYPTQFNIILKVKPGITGLSQVSGRTELLRSEQLELDMFYADHWSFRFDFSILLRTARAVLSGRGQVNYRSREDAER